MTSNSATGLPTLTQAVSAFLAAGGQVLRDGTTLSLSGATEAAACHAWGVLSAHLDELALLCIPSVTPKEAAAVRELLDEACGGKITYVVTEAAARDAVAVLRDEYHHDLREHGQAVVGMDFETEVLQHLREPIPVNFTKSGQLAKRQAKEGAAGRALDPFSSRVRLVQMWVTGAVYVFDLRSVPWSVFDLLFDDPAIEWAIFNAVFEAKRLLHEVGRLPAGRIYDVMTAMWLTHGKRPGLEEAADVALGITVPKGLGASDWSADTLSREQLEYAALDAVLCVALWQEQREAFANTRNELVQRVADDCIEVVAAAELVGVKVDTAAHAGMLEQWLADLEKAQKARAAAVRELPWVKRGPAQRRRKRKGDGVLPGDLDWRSRDEVQAHLTAALTFSENGQDALDDWPLTPSGLLATDRASLVQGAHLPGIKEHIEVRGLAKLIEAFGTGFVAKINPATGRVHTSLLIAGARTSRFSSRAPNLQQLPKKRSREFRNIVIAAPGYVLMAADYNQIEMRAAAEAIYALVGVSRMRDGFAAGLDAHRITGMHLAGKTDPATVTDDERDHAKAPNFGCIYGMRERGFFRYVRANYQADVTFDVAADLYYAMHGVYPELSEWQDLQARQSRRDGYVETPLGRRWYWEWQAKDLDEVDPEEPFFEDKLVGFQRNYSLNHGIQGGCAEVMLIALRRVHDAIKDLPARILLTVHDEILLEVSDDTAVVVKVHDILVRELTAAFLDVYPDAPTLNLVDPTVGAAWGSMVKFARWLESRTAVAA